MERSSQLFRGIAQACIGTILVSLLVTIFLTFSLHNSNWILVSDEKLSQQASLILGLIFLLPLFTGLAIIQVFNNHWTRQILSNKIMEKELEDIQETLQYFSDGGKDVKSSSFLVKNIQRWKSKYHETIINDGYHSWYVAGINELDGLLQLSDKKVLLNSFVQFITQYVNYLEGTIFIIEEVDGEKRLRQQNLWINDLLISNAQKTIQPGVGLVGQCFLEKREIEMHSIPAQYFHELPSDVSSPMEVMIVPVKNDSHIEGVIELAGKQPLNQYEITFLRKACERLATTLQLKNQYYSRQQIQIFTNEIKSQEVEIKEALEELMQKENIHLTRINELEEAVADFQRRELEYRHKVKLYDLLNK